MEPRLFEAKKHHLSGDRSNDETARRLGNSLVRLNNLIHRTRRRYRRLLRPEVAGSLMDAAEADQEVRDLLKAVLA